MLRLQRCFNFINIIKIMPTIINSSFRYFNHSIVTNSKSLKVAVLGAAGKTGNCLSLLLKQSSLIDELALYDTDSLQSITLELSHIDTKCKVTSYEAGETGLKYILENASIVMITAEKFMKMKSSYEEILKQNAEILIDYIQNVIRYSPRAMVAITTSPINSLIPLTAEMYKKAGILDYSRIFGVTSLDCMRANHFAAELLGLQSECVTVPVIGGSGSETCVPVFSQMKPHIEFTQEEFNKLICFMKKADSDVAKKYDGKGSLSLAKGFAAARFCISLCKAIQDYPGIMEYAYVRSYVMPEVTYFTSLLQLGPSGIQKHLDLPILTERENEMMSIVIKELKIAIKLGEKLALGIKEVSTEVYDVNQSKISVSSENQLSVK